jgi:hypothetical protein
MDANPSFLRDKVDSIPFKKKREGFLYREKMHVPWLAPGEGHNKTWFSRELVRILKENLVLKKTCSHPY